MNAFEAYQKYVALKQHFKTPSYDYFKFAGKCGVSRASFEVRRDKHFFQRISRLYKDDDLEQLFISNFLENPDCWIGHISSPEGKQTLLLWKKQIQGLQYSFIQDMQKLQELIESNKLPSFDSLFVHTPDTNWPLLVQLAMQKQVSFESFVILNKIFNFLPRFSKTIQDDILWPSFRHKCLKYSPFLSVDVVRYKKILRDIFVEMNLAKNP